MKIDSRLFRATPAGVAGGLAVLLSLALLPAGHSAPTPSGTNAPPKLKIQDTPLRSEVKAGTSFAAVVKQVGPSVVNIYSTVTIRERPNPMLSDPFWRRFFGPGIGDQGQPRSRKEQSLGSGVIISPEGYILTANHVVEGADKVKVALASGAKEFDAKVIGTDPPTDTAVLKVEGSDLPAITIADSDKLEVGDVVLAIGNPFNIGQTVSMGIVSALGRGGFGINAYEDFIQTDAAINPGNSGGPLVDAQGRLVGINTWIISRSGGFQGLGFAVPINMVWHVMDRLIGEGKVSRGYLGLMLQPEVSSDLQKQFALPDLNGALVTSVEPNSPASKAGLKEGDFITQFNGKKVTDMRQFRLLVSQAAPGTRATLKVWRGGAEKTLTATLGTLPEELLARGGPGQPGPRSPATPDGLDGVEVGNLDAVKRREYGVPNSVRGALTTAVDPESNAAEAGLREGDIIMEIDRQPVRTAEDAVALSDKAKGEQILLRVWRGDGSGGRGGTLFIPVDNAKRK